MLQFSPGQPTMQIVDTHQHLWDMDLFRYSWLASVPSLNRSFRMPDYLAAAKGLNVVKSVHLEADVDEPYMLDETRHLLALADQPDNPLEGIVACGRPESENFKSYLDKIAGHPRGKGNSSCTPYSTGRSGPGSDLHQERGCALGATAFRSTSVFWLGSFPSRSN